MKRLSKLEIFNDPIYGFIRIPNSQVFHLIDHPFFQRLRRISQMGMSYLVYPGAHHTRFHHALGAMHLMQEAIDMLRLKGVKISEAEEEGLLAAILLHDIGHGPFSHALEQEWIPGMDHEAISLAFMEALNRESSGQLEMALSIFTGKHPRKFLNELVSSQLDMDRLDYLKRDSFYTGVAEGNINAERLITMLNVHEDRLVVEEKGVYSVEKFLMARRFMYWQVYLHKTGLAAEQILVRIIRRARELQRQGLLESPGGALGTFLGKPEKAGGITTGQLEAFARLDDVDILYALKRWMDTKDPVLSRLCRMLLHRQLPSIKLRQKPVSPEKLAKKKARVCEAWGLSEAEAAYFVFGGQVENRAYNRKRQNINILLSNGKITDVASRTDRLNLEVLSEPVVKHYICYPKKGI
ncbi:HD domain-containing protein [Robiginitalea sp. M366]|uniref:HD domain-containing protein n=1 Tax=Robiginitalea aestuariiviva TaxID=3036903 RepID=UPI00240D1CAB|nr:HD domain-containing protein [Robiginitalea aestuariiviva]MDG1572976.1 HD domain-containing protein [Robiginitalea aestuariiviva]